MIQRTIYFVCQDRLIIRLAYYKEELHFYVTLRNIKIKFESTRLTPCVTSLLTVFLKLTVLTKNEVQIVICHLKKLSITRQDCSVKMIDNYFCTIINLFSFSQFICFLIVCYFIKITWNFLYCVIHVCFRFIWNCKF